MVIEVNALVSRLIDCSGIPALGGRWHGQSERESCTLCGGGLETCVHTVKFLADGCDMLATTGSRNLSLTEITCGASGG